MSLMAVLCSPSLQAQNNWVFSNEDSCRYWVKIRYGHTFWCTPCFDINSCWSTALGQMTNACCLCDVPCANNPPSPFYHCGNPQDTLITLNAFSTVTMPSLAPTGSGAACDFEIYGLGMQLIHQCSCDQTESDCHLVDTNGAASCPGNCLCPYPIVIDITPGWTIKIRPQ